MNQDELSSVAKGELIRTGIAAGSFLLMLAGVALLSVPWAMILGGGLLLAAAIYGQFRQPPKVNQ